MKTIPEKWLYSKLGGFQKYTGKSWSKCEANEVIDWLYYLREDRDRWKRKYENCKNNILWE